MRILYVTNYQGPSVTAQRGHVRNRNFGANRKIEIIASGLAERGHQVEVLSPATVSEGTLRWYSGFEGREHGLGRARVRYLGGIDMPRVSVLAGSRQLRHYFKSAPDVDAVLLYNLEWYFLQPTAAFARRIGVPLVVEYEDDAVTTIGARFKGWHVWRGRRAMELARREATGVVAVSPELSRQLDCKNSMVLPGLIDGDLMSIRRDSSGTGTGPLRVFYSGGITFPKGPDLLVDAASRLGPDFEFDIVGNGPGLAELRAQAAYGRGTVRIHGELSREELVRLLGRADVGINPHRMSIGERGQVFPFKIVEYIGAGLPVVTTRFGEFPLPAKDSLVICEEDSAEAIAEALRVAKSRIQALRLAAADARRWVDAKYSKRVAAEDLEGVLLTAIVSAGHHGRRSARCEPSRES